MPLMHTTMLGLNKLHHCFFYKFMGICTFSSQLNINTIILSRFSRCITHTNKM